MKRIILFRYHAHLDVCRERIALLRRYNPDTPLYGLYGGPREDEAVARTLDLDEVFTLPIDDPYWKWKNGDLCVRWWYREVGRYLVWDMVHVIDWDILLFEPVETWYRHVTDGVALANAASINIYESTGWWWITGDHGASDYRHLRDLARERLGYTGTPTVGVFPGASFSREFLRRYGEIEVPSLCNDEVRVGLFAGAFGMTVHRIEGGTYFNCEKEYFSRERIREGYAAGVRFFHPVREVVGIEDIA